MEAPIVPESILFAGAEVTEDPKVIFGFGGVFVPRAPYELDHALEWQKGSMFDGDEFYFSPDHGELVEALVECGIEVYILSGMGMSAVLEMRNFFDLKRRTMEHVNWLNTYSDFDIGLGPSPVQRKVTTVRSVCAYSVDTVVWVDPSAWMLQEAENFKPVVTNPNAGMTLDDLAEIAEWTIGDDWSDDEWEDGELF